VTERRLVGTCRTTWSRFIDWGAKIGGMMTNDKPVSAGMCSKKLWEAEFLQRTRQCQ
jgi:hypothetical protein